MYDIIITSFPPQAAHLANEEECSIAVNGNVYIIDFASSQQVSNTLILLRVYLITAGNDMYVYSLGPCLQHVMLN